MNLFTRTFSKIFKSSNQQELDKIQNLILAINNKENEITSLTESQIKEKTDNLKKNVQNGSIKLDDIIPESFALVREAAKRTLGERRAKLKVKSNKTRPDQEWFMQSPFRTRPLTLTQTSTVHSGYTARYECRFRL